MTIEIYEFIDTIETQEQFIEFLARLLKDYEEDAAGWENATILSYVDAMYSWTEDMGTRLPDQPSWHLFASILYAATMYE